MKNGTVTVFEGVGAGIRAAAENAMNDRVAPGAPPGIGTVTGE